jgi:hypothetical protein
MNEAAWQAAAEISLDWEWTPGDNTPPPVRTVCRITYDASNLYIGCRAWDPRPGEIRAHLADRDDIHRVAQNDHILILLDPFNDERRAFQFRVNARGVQADAVLSTAEGVEDWSWDAIWDANASRDSEGYTVEVALPFRSLRFPRTSEVQTWGVILERSYPRTVRHRMQSAPYDRNNSCALCQANKVTGFQGIAPGRNVELTPTVTTSRTDRRDELPDGAMQQGDFDPEAGLDLRWGITPNVSLNGTVNPDFSQVEADVAQLDVNTRFALFYPEKRPFFLEGADLFNTPIEAVFTRTIADPDAGLKASGKVGRSTNNGVGLFSARDAVTNILLPANQGSAQTQLDQEAYTAVGRYRRDFGQSSYVGLLYTGRFGDGYTNQVAGVDVFHQISPSNSIRAQYLASTTEYPDQVVTDFGQPEGQFAGGAFRAALSHFSEDWFAQVYYDDRSPEFRADMGFVPRVDTRQYQADVYRIFRRDKGWYTQLNVGTSFGQTYDHDGDLTDQFAGVGLNYQGPLQSQAGTALYLTRENYLGTLYDLIVFRPDFQFRPTGNLSVGVSGTFGEAIDFTNARESDQVVISPFVELRVGTGIAVNASHSLQRLSYSGNRVFTANLFQSRIFYYFNRRTLVRAVIQYRDVSRDPDQYVDPVNAEDRSLFGQFLFSYKVNAQTVVFLGYSETTGGTQDYDLTTRDRTVFAKVGYAWRP